MNVTVARALSSDVAPVCDLDRRVLGSDERSNHLQQKISAGQCYVARAGRQVIGFVVTDRSFFGQAFVDLLIVDPAFRRRGVGTSLMHHVESIWQPGKLFTSTNASNVSMQRLCESLGYVRSGVINNLDEDDPEIVYFKRLI